MACWLDSGLLVLLIIISVLITVVAMLVFYDFEFCEKYSMMNYSDCMVNI